MKEDASALLYTYEDSIVKPTKYCWKERGRERMEI
jgi:hypothetical protein